MASGGTLVNNKWNKLRHLLHHLPTSVPLLPPDQCTYPFDGFTIDPEQFDRFESNAAVVNRQLEITFGQQNPRDAQDRRIITFSERGPSLEAVVDILEEHVNGPEDANCTGPLLLWMRDLSASAEHAYELAKVSNNCQASGYTSIGGLQMIP